MTRIRAYFSIMLYRLLTYLVFAVAIIALGEWDAQNRRFAFTEKVNDWWLEFCIGNARDKISDASVTLVSVGDDYDPVLEGDALSRLDYVVLLGNIEHFKPRAVSVAPIVAFGKANVLNQGALKKQVLKMPRLTLGSLAESGTPATEGEPAVPYPLVASVEGDISGIPQIAKAGVLPDAEPLANGVAAFTGIDLLEVDESAEPAVQLVGRMDDQLVVSFVLQSLLADADLKIEDLSVSLPPASKTGKVRVGERYTIPIDAAGRLAAYPHSGVKPPFFPVVNARHLPLATADDPAVAERREEFGEDFDSLARNLVVIGETGDNAHKVTLSNGETYTEHEWLVRSIAIVQSGRYIERWPVWAKYAGIALILILAALLFRLRRLPILFWGFVAAFLYVFGICMGSFKEWLVWTPPLVPLALFAGILIVGLILPPSPEKAADADAIAGDDDSDRAEADATAKA